MNNVQLRYRLFPQTIDPQWEWSYLLNETYEGERCIVPLLRHILAQGKHKLPASLVDALETQVEEEIRHIRYFAELVGQQSLKSSGYGARLTALVRDLPTETLRLFALQTMLEGMALGALNYRKTVVQKAPSKEVDGEVHEDETRHVTLSYAYLKDLQRVEGVHSPSMFRRIAHEVNEIFTDTFRGEFIANLLKENHGVAIDPHAIEQSEAMRFFRNQSVSQLVETKRTFLEEYRRVANG